MFDEFSMKIEENKLDICGIYILKNGEKFYEKRWKEDKPHALFSVSKSFVSTAIGMCIDYGILSLEDEVLPLFTDENIHPDKKLEHLKIRHLITMTAGFKDGFLFEERYNLEEKDWVKYTLDYPVTDEPGTKFCYNNACTYLLSVIIQKITGKKTVDFLGERLFKPLGIEDYSWDECPRGYTFGATGLMLTTEQLSRFGQLYLNMGNWHGKQIISRKWLMEATSFQVPAMLEDPNRIWYGYQFWYCPYNGYRADGMMGQFCIIHPQLGTVIAINSDEERMDVIANLVWKYVMPELI